MNKLNVPDWLRGRLRIVQHGVQDQALGERLAGIIPEARNCDYCDLTVYEQTIKIEYQDTPEPHWRSHCDVCHRYRHPESGEFCLTKARLVAYYKDNKGKT